MASSISTNLLRYSSSFSGCSSMSCLIVLPSTFLVETAQQLPTLLISARAGTLIPACSARVRFKASFRISAEGLLPLNTLTTVSPLSYTTLLLRSTITFLSALSSITTSNKVLMQILTIHLVVLSFFSNFSWREEHSYWLNGWQIRRT